MGANESSGPRPGVRWVPLLRPPPLAPGWTCVVLAPGQVCSGCRPCGHTSPDLPGGFGLSTSPCLQFPLSSGLHLLWDGWRHPDSYSPEMSRPSGLPEARSPGLDSFDQCPGRPAAPSLVQLQHEDWLTAPLSWEQRPGRARGCGGQTLTFRQPCANVRLR